MLSVPEMNFIVGECVTRTRVVKLFYICIFSPMVREQTGGQGRNAHTLPGQSRHLILHSETALGPVLRRVASNLSSGYLACNSCIATVSHGGRTCC